jgi:iron complex outermembrane receptor protein
MKKIMSIVFFLFMFFNIYPQTFGDLSVKVFDKTSSKPLYGAIVKIESQNLVSVTDKNGNAGLNKINPGVVKVTCSFTGYASHSEKVTISAGTKSDINFHLSDEAIPIPEVVVTATRGIERETPITFTNLPSEDIQKLTRSNDLTYALNSLPSVNLHSENGNGLGYSYIRLRGFDQRRISVLINGVPQNDPEDHSVYWINFYDLAGSLEDAQVQRGAGAAFYGPPSIGGSINLVTKSPSSVSSITTEAGYGSFNTHKYSLSAHSGKIGNHFNFYGRVTRVTSDGYRDWSWSKFWRYFAGASYNDQNHSLRINFWGGPQEDGLAFYGIPKTDNNDELLRKANYGSYLKDREYLNQPQFSFAHDFKLNTDLTLHNTLFFISGDGYFDFDGTWGTNDYYRIDTNLTIPSDLVMRAFVDNDHFGWLPRIEWRDSFGRSIFGAEFRIHRSLHWGRIQSGSGLPESVYGESGKHHYEYKGGKDVFSLFSSQLIKLTEKITVLGDLQIVYQKYKIFDELYAGNNFQTPYLFVNPKLGVNFNLTEKFSLYFSSAYTKREPPLKNLYEAESASWGVEPQFEKNLDGSFNFDKPLVKPEKLLNFEFGQRYSSSLIRINSNFYWMEFIDEIVPSGGLDVFGQPRVGNAERTRHFGFELESAFRVFKGFDWNFNLNLSRNRFIKFVEYDQNGLPLVRDNNIIANAPELIFGSIINYAVNDYFVSLAVKYTGKQFTDNSQTSDKNDSDVTVDAFTVVDLRAGYNLPIDFVTVSLSIEVNNLFNKKYLMNGFGKDNFFPAATRNYFLSLKVSY